MRCLLYIIFVSLSIYPIFMAINFVITDYCMMDMLDVFEIFEDLCCFHLPFQLCEDIGEKSNSFVGGFIVINISDWTKEILVVA